MRTLARLLALALLATELVPRAALAQDVEPNDTCVPAAEPRAIGLPDVLTGSLAALDAGLTSDVDFYVLATVPRARLRLTGARNRLIGVFDEACRLRDRSAQSGTIDLTAPASGVLVLAVAGRSDMSFDGQAISGNAGPYQLTITRQPASIGAISGRVVDGVSGEPLSGMQRPFASVRLRRCPPGDPGQCTFVGEQDVDGAGRFHFELDTSKLRVAPGEFVLTAEADRYRFAEAAFSVAADEVRDIGDVALAPPSLLLTNTSPCASLGPDGGRCAYSVTLQNATASSLRGTARSVVGYFFGGPRRFEVSAREDGDVADVERARLDIPPHDRRTVRFFLDVPAAVPDGSLICTDLLVGVEPSPVTNTVLDESLFCLMKGPAGLRVMSPLESRAARATLVD